MTLQTIRKILFTMLAMFALEAYAEDKAGCGKPAAQLPLDRSGDLGQQASIGVAASSSAAAVAQQASQLLNRIAGETNASCCKICRNSQACGDDCINWSKICHVGPGCACQQ